MGASVRRRRTRSEVIEGGLDTADEESPAGGGRGAGAGAGGGGPGPPGGWGTGRRGGRGRRRGGRPAGAPPRGPPGGAPPAPRPAPASPPPPPAPPPRPPRRRGGGPPGTPPRAPAGSPGAPPPAGCLHAGWASWVLELLTWRSSFLVWLLCLAGKGARPASTGGGVWQGRSASGSGRQRCKGQDGFLHGWASWVLELLTWRSFLAFLLGLCGRGREGGSGCGGEGSPGTAGGRGSARRVTLSLPPAGAPYSLLLRHRPPALQRPPAKCSGGQAALGVRVGREGRSASRSGSRGARAGSILSNTPTHPSRFPSDAQQQFTRGTATLEVEVEDHRGFSSTLAVG